MKIKIEQFIEHLMLEIFKNIKNSFILSYIGFINGFVLNTILSSDGINPCKRIILVLLLVFSWYIYFKTIYKIINAYNYSYNRLKEHKKKSQSPNTKSSIEKNQKQALINDFDRLKPNVNFEEYNDLKDDKMKLLIEKKDKSQSPNTKSSIEKNQKQALINAFDRLKPNENFEGYNDLKDEDKKLLREKKYRKMCRNITIFTLLLIISTIGAFGLTIGIKVKNSNSNKKYNETIYNNLESIDSSLVSFKKYKESIDSSLVSMNDKNGKQIILLLDDLSSNQDSILKYMKKLEEKKVVKEPKKSTKSINKNKKD